jgi:hypothetical protein
VQKRMHKRLRQLQKQYDDPIEEEIKHRSKFIR